MILKKIPILIDNYVWILLDKRRNCVILDPGVSDPIIKKIEKEKWNPIAILLTHQHSDHVNGVKYLIKKYPLINVFGPHETKEYGVKNIVKSGNRINLLNKDFYVFHTPGHTVGHISYYSKPYFFCGDTIFSGGCGKVFNQLFSEMYCSLKFISFFPGSTILCCSHEYTLSNLYFSTSILPNDLMIKNFYKKIKTLRKFNKSTLPTNLLIEKKINIFLRTEEKMIKKKLELKKTCTSFEVFKELRLRKDKFIWS